MRFGPPPTARELVREVAVGSEVHLIWRLSLKSRMGETSVVFRDVERDESLKRRNRVERVEIEPLMLQRSPPGLNHGVREGDLDHRKESSRNARADEFIDLRVGVLDTGIGEEGGWPGGRNDTARNLEENRDRVPGIEAF